MTSITLYHIMQEPKQFNNMLKNSGKNEFLKKTDERGPVVCFTSFRGSLAYAAAQIKNDISEKRIHHANGTAFTLDNENDMHGKWLRLVLKVNDADLNYPDWQFSFDSLVPFYLVCKYQRRINQALKFTKRQRPILNLTKEGITDAAVIGIHALPLGENRFSVYYRSSEGFTFLSPSFLVEKQPAILSRIVSWYAREDAAFLNEYNQILHTVARRRPAVIETGEALFPAFVINPADNPLCYGDGVMPRVSHVTRLNKALLPSVEEISDLIKQDISMSALLEQVSESDILKRPIWRPAFVETVSELSYQFGREKVKYNALHRRKTLWQKIMNHMKKLNVRQ